MKSIVTLACVGGALAWVGLACIRRSNRGGDGGVGQALIGLAFMVIAFAFLLVALLAAIKS
jgi:hypothetical protein